MKPRELELGRSQHGTPPETAPMALDDGLDAASLGAREYAVRVAPEEWRPSIWDALVGYGYWGYAEVERSVLAEPRGRWLLDEEDFSSEHGYETGFEGRSEFEHGEFDRWV